METKILGQGDDNGADTAMTLSYIAFCKNIEGALGQYVPEWKLVWAPAETIEGNLAFIAYNGSQYAVAIRGSMLNFSMDAFDNWFKEDFNIIEQVHWKYPANDEVKPMISKGAELGLASLAKLVNEKGETILDYLLENLKPDDSLCVTGHSLGGGLSTVFAPWLHYQIGQAGKPVPSLFSVLTFAAPTAGNDAFAKHYDDLFPNSWRYYNVIDVVPHSADMLSQIAALFPEPGYTAHQADLANVILILSDLVKASEKFHNSFYSHTNQNRGSVPLNTDEEIFPVTSTEKTLAWFEQVGWQHDQASYLKFLGAKPMNCVEAASG